LRDYSRDVAVKALPELNAAVFGVSAALAIEYVLRSVAALSLHEAAG
jgi:hypothetical protein